MSLTLAAHDVCVCLRALISWIWNECILITEYPHALLLRRGQEWRVTARVQCQHERTPEWKWLELKLPQLQVRLKGPKMASEAILDYQISLGGACPRSCCVLTHAVTYSARPIRFASAGPGYTQKQWTDYPASRKILVYINSCEHFKLQTDARLLICARGSCWNRLTLSSRPCGREQVWLHMQDHCFFHEFITDLQLRIIHGYTATLTDMLYIFHKYSHCLACSSQESPYHM